MSLRGVVAFLAPPPPSPKVSFIVSKVGYRSPFHEMDQRDSKGGGFLRNEAIFAIQDEEQFYGEDEVRRAG